MSRLSFLPYPIRAFLAFLACVSGLLASANVAAQALLPPIMAVQKGEKPIALVAADARAEVSGTLAVTRLTLVFLNPNGRALEGNLQFPLLEGQTVTGFALQSVDGPMLPAVPVDKARGRQVFEDIERRGADPALLEQVAGNRFNLRVYPLLPGKPRQVTLEITEILQPGRDGRLAWQLPLDFGGTPPGKLTLLAEVHGIPARSLRLGAGLAGSQTMDRHGSATVLLDKAAPRGRLAAAMTWPQPVTESVLAGSFDGESWFHAEIPLKAPPQPRTPPRRVAIVWDASGSGAERDHQKEFALLDAWFHTLDEVRIALVIARDRAEAPREFLVRKGDWRELRSALESAAYDGASNRQAWALPAGLADLGLVFTDGQANWAETDSAIASAIPTYTLNAAAGPNTSLLRRMAEHSGGRHIDLLRVSTADALRELQLKRPRVSRIEAQGADQVELAAAYAENDRLRVAGRLSGGPVTLKLILDTPQGRSLERTVRLPLPPTLVADEVPARRWAAMRIARLEALPSLHRTEIRSLGERFSLPSSGTSLLVLESLADHLRYGVRPPEGPWRVEYDQRRTRESGDRATQRTRHVDALARRFAEREKWWDTDFPKGTPPQPEPPKKSVVRPAVAAAAMVEERERDASRRQEQMARPLMARPAPMPAPAAVRPDGFAQAAAPLEASIRLQKWQPDAPYARRLREAGDADRYAVYLDERPAHPDSTAFFLDAADIFFDKGQRELGMRILSNLAEMKLENRDLLRILAYRLLQANEPKPALPLLKQVRDLAPDEPQSWRDLGLALAADGQAQAAAEALWETASRPWDGRFADIDLIALGEMNALAARTPGVDLSRMDPRLTRNLPLDLRAVLAWDTDNTDIDLWVVDPNGEKVFYSHPLSYQGGRITRDATGGYGPEEFALKIAKPGRYEVRAQFYGHRQQVLSPYTTLMLKLSTGFGTPSQKDENVILRLSDRKDEVLVGTFEVGGKAR